MHEREIKFKRLMRYKDDGKLSWSYDDLSQVKNLLIVLPPEASAEWVSPVLEFSGLMINGVDVYEGDKGSNEVAEWEVVFNKGCFCAKRIDPMAKSDSDTHAALRAIVGFKPTGNIYEEKFKNP